MYDRHAALPATLQRLVLDGPGSVEPGLRRALAGGDDGPVPEVLAVYARLVRETAYLVSDQDVATVVAAGYTEDQVYEVTVATSVGAGAVRLDAGMRALAESLAATPETPAACGPGPVARDTPGGPWAPTLTGGADPLPRRDGEARP